MFYKEVIAGDSFSFSTNVALSNTMTWTANGFLTTLDLLDVLSGNTDIGILAANLALIDTNTPNSVNYTLTLTADSNTTSQWMANSVNINERKLFLFPKYTSNTGIVINGNSSIVIVKANSQH